MSSPESTDIRVAGKPAAVAVDSPVERRRRDALRQAVIEGCHGMAQVYLEVEQEYHLLEEEIHRALEP